MKKLIFIFVLFFSTFVWAGDYSFSVVKSGVGKQSILFIPGFACSGDVWQETVQVLKESNTCYVLTMAGFAGVSPEKNPSFEGWKNQIAQFIQEEGIEQPIIVGHSMGGGLVLALASDFPQLIKKIIIVDTLPCLTALTNPNFKSVPGKDYSAFISQIVGMNENDFTQMLKMSVASLTTDTLKYNQIVDWGLSSDKRTYAQLYCDFSNTDLRERIKNITVPALILLESPFKHIMPSIAEQYERMPKADLRYAGKGLHFLMYDDKEWFITQVSGFIKE